MTRPPATLAALAMALATAAHAAAPAVPARPVVVELFQSQGCSSCPPANANVMALADRPDVLALSFQVTYWDQLGWKDTFGSPLNTARQWDYAYAWKRSNVATPEVVVNGQRDAIGSNRAELEALIRAADRTPGPTVTIGGGKVVVASATNAKPAAVWLVRYDPNIVQVPIKRGENGGRTLPHRNVVRELVRLGDWAGAAKTYALPAASRADLKTAILVQQGPGGAIVAAARA